MVVVRERLLIIKMITDSYSARVVSALAAVRTSDGYCRNSNVPVEAPNAV